MSRPYQGYPGEVWATCYAALAWFTERVADGGTGENYSSPANAVYWTLRNGLEAISAYALANALAAEYSNIQSVAALPLSLTTEQQAALNNRFASVTAAASGTASLAPSLDLAGVSAALESGNPAIASPNLLSYYLTFAAETPPSGFTAATLATDATSFATAWLGIAQAIGVLQGERRTRAYDAALRQYRCSALAAEQARSFVSSSFSDSVGGATYLWNQMVAWPAITADANVLIGAPFNFENQQIATIRYTLGSAMNQMATLLTIMRQPVLANTSLARVRNNDTLMDVAARETGDFENWQSIATLNGLQPPWTGPGGTAYGSQVLLPTGQQQPTSSVIPNYETNLLGVDFYLGPVNSPMLPWVGDFQLIAGYNNLRNALGRRLQTPIGSLIYHMDFGSRIPFEVGAVQNQETAGHITAYGVSALLSDPRVAAVPSAFTVIASGGAGLASFTGDVEPVGWNAVALRVNEVLAPLG